MAYEEPTTKKFKHSIISGHIFEPEFQEIFCKNWHGRTPFKNSDIEIIAEPFRVCKISNFLKSEDFMEDLKNELIDVKTRRNSIDLYQFEQSNDLSEVDRNNIKTLYHTFQTNLSDWMQKNTKVVLNRVISMTSSCYSDTDYLLCHDDNLADRKIAFILYLSKDWAEEDGGALDLFDTDEDGLPRNVVKSIIPEYNSLVFFEVAHNSYHQVAEVTSSVKSRWSINGWFHGPLVLPGKAQRPEPVINFFAPENIEVDLSQWISNNYLFPGILQEINEDVEQESFTFLSNFLKESVYEILSQEIQRADIQWRRVGPADVRNYEVAEEDSLPTTLADFCRIFKSKTVFELLKSYTQLDLVAVADHMNPRVTIELQRWSSGCYTLITDKISHEDIDTSTSSDKRTVDSAGKYEFEAAVGDESSSASKTKLPRLQDNYVEEYEASERNLQENTSCNTPPISTGDDEVAGEVVAEVEVAEEEVAEEEVSEEEVMEEEVAEEEVAEEQVALALAEEEVALREEEVVAVTEEELAAATRRRAKDNSSRRERGEDLDDSDDSDVSDIGDYLSDPPDPTDEAEADAEAEAAELGSLDVIMQFNTGQLDKVGIDYIDPREEDAALIYVPSKDNHLCLVYRNCGICRVHRYVNHYVQGHFYNLVCTYIE